MLLKRVSIPLDDLRLKKSENNTIKVSSMACDQRSDNQQAKHTAAGKEIGSEETRSNQSIKSDASEEEEESYEVKKVSALKKVVKVISSGSEENDDENEISDSEEEKKKTKKRYQKPNRTVKKASKYKFQDDDSDDPDFDPQAENKKLKKQAAESVPDRIFIKKKENLSPYELMIQKNREEKMAFLQSLKIEEAKAGLTEIFEQAAVKKKSQPVKRTYKKVQSPTSPPVLRKSRRLAKLDIDLSEKTLYSNALKTALEGEREKNFKNETKGKPKRTENDQNWQPSYRFTILTSRRGRRSRRNRREKKEVKSSRSNFHNTIVIKEIPPEMTFKEALQSEEFYESYRVDINIQESKSEPKFCLYDKSVLKKMKVSESNIAKITPARITALTWYPSPEQMIVTAGDKYGNLGILNLESECDPYRLKIHLEGITNLKFNPFNRVQLVSSSYDGILRCGDMVQHNFKEVYNVSDETTCTYFDFLSATTYLVAQRNGQVALVDKRTEGKSCEKKHRCHDYSVKTVNIHPMNKSYFVTAENKGTIRLWDLRKLQNTPVADITHHKRATHSAFFSPVLGNSILATSADNSISIFDSTNLTSDIQMTKQMKHDNQTGRWLSVFRATWLPNSDEAFVIGSMQYPRRIEVFDKNMFVYCLMQHDNLATITSTNAFHPMRPALAGGNSSGKVVVFE